MLSHQPKAAPSIPREIRTHIPEDFWSIEVKAAPTGDQPGCTFAWLRGRLFDQPAAAMLHELCCDHPTATVAEVGPWNGKAQEQRCSGE